MHREIVGAPLGIQVDHRNGNGLDNRRRNLRLATRRQNAANHKLPRNNRSGCSGVWFDKGRAKWQVRIGKKFFGRFDTYMEACAARRSAEKKAFGSFAHR